MSKIPQVVILILLPILFVAFFKRNDTAATIKQLLPLLKMYDVYDENGPLVMSRYGNEHDGGYVVPEKAIKLADVLLGYGIDKDNSFEDDFSIRQHKPSYGFDCGIDGIASKSKLFTFIPECLGTNQTLYNSHKNGKNAQRISTFPQELQSLGLKGKKVFIKMDIEGAEFQVFQDILPLQKDITGIAIELHMITAENIRQATSLLAKLNKHFLLIHVHNNLSTIKWSHRKILGSLTGHLELTYINKSLVTGYNQRSRQLIPSSPLHNTVTPDAPEILAEISD